MNEASKAMLTEKWNSRPEGMRYARASESDLLGFEAKHGQIPPDFRWFLSACGGGVVGTEWVDGIVQLNDTHEKYKLELGPSGWHNREVFIIGWDGAGNPFGIHTASGGVFVEDHNFGGIHELSPSFEVFLNQGLLGRAL